MNPIVPQPEGTVRMNANQGRTSGPEAQRVTAHRSTHWLLGAMLLLLHLATWWDFASPLSRSLILAHLGLFFLWQPLWQRDQRLEPRSILFFLLFTIGFVIWFSWWVLNAWLILLIGLVGGSVPVNENERYAHLLTLLFLVSELLIAGVTGLFGVSSLPAGVTDLFKYGLLAVPVCLAVIPKSIRADNRILPLDLFRGVTIALIAAMLALGSLLNMYHRGVQYPVALFQTLLGLGAFLFALSWLSSIPGGLRGLGQLWERSLLNIGTPFERWLTEIAKLAEQRQTPQEFLEAAMLEFVELPWIVGAVYATVDEDGEVGQRVGYPIRLKAADVEITLFTRRPVGPTLHMHCRLLVQLVGYFYTAKLRETELAQRAHLQAIYETGARVTHDIKNLLQSLQAITLALDTGDRIERREGQRLLLRQLPHITQRLQLALDKLQEPDKAFADETPLRTWWEELKTRNNAGNIEFRSEIDANPAIPSELFDSVVENLLENARNKRQVEPSIEITVALAAREGSLRLNVCDTGSAVDAEVARKLCRQPVNSRNGLGIGLYQAARQAHMLGYTLGLRHNEAGRVCLELVKRPAAESTKDQYSLFAAR